MIKYVLKRIFYMVITLWIIATVTFFLMSAMPGNPIKTQVKQLPKETQDEILHQYGLDRPVGERYISYLNDLVHGNLGDSYITPGLNATDLIKLKVPASARIGLQAIFISLIIGLILGILAAFNRGTFIDYIVMFIAILGVSLPSFVLACLLQKAFGGKANLPIAGWYDKGSGYFSTLRYTILPTMALSFLSIATYARFMRSSVLDVVGQDYVITARAKGVSNIALTWKHIIRNAILPIITMLGPQIAGIMGGALVIERIFAIPGIGSQLVDSINGKDYNIIMGLTVFFAFLYIVSLLVVDLLYVLVDPRIRLTGGKR